MWKYINPPRINYFALGTMLPVLLISAVNKNPMMVCLFIFLIVVNAFCIKKFEKGE